MSEVNGVHQWFIARDGKQTGPISDMEIKAIAAHGYFKATDLVWRAGFAEWHPALSIFAPAVAPPPLAPRPAPPAPAPVAVAPAPQPASIQTAPTQSSPVQTTASPHQSTASPLRQLELRPTQPRDPATAPVMRDQTAGRPAARTDERPMHQPPAQHASPQQPTQKLPQAWVPPNPAGYLDPRQQPGAYGAIGGNDPRFGTQQGQAYPSEPNPTQGQPSQARSVRPVALGDEPEAEMTAPKTNRMALAALLIFIAALAGGIWVAASPGLFGGTTSGVFTAATGLLAGGSTSSSGSLDAKLQKTAHWPVIKREFPDWYGERLREAVQLASENRPEDEINKALVDQLITLRRQNSAQALAASPLKLRALASAFLANLRQLKSQSTTACFNFISQGEGTPGVIDQFQSADGAKSPMQLQVAAIFEAIGEGRKSPVTHEKPIKADYDTLMDQLAKLGWSQTDVATFADPKALARAEPARVCQMVQDWFVAHISITDDATQERLLGETLRPVVSG
jgi:hypothetical protein